VNQQQQQGPKVRYQGHPTQLCRGKQERKGKSETRNKEKGKKERLD